MISTDKNKIIINSERASLDDRADCEKAIALLVNLGEKSIIIDLSKTVYLPSEFMGFMMWKKKDLSELNISLTINAISTSLKRTFDSAMLSDFFGLDDNTQVVEANF